MLGSCGCHSKNFLVELKVCQMADHHRPTDTNQSQPPPSNSDEYSGHFQGYPPAAGSGGADDQGGYPPSAYMQPGYESYGYQPPQWGTGITPHHSKLGVASFVLGLVAGLMIVAMYIVIGTVIDRNPHLLEENFQHIDPSGPMPPAVQKVFPALAAAACSAFLGIALAVLGGALGLISLTAKGARRGFGITGIIINGLIVVGCIGSVLLNFI